MTEDTDRAASSAGYAATHCRQCAAGWTRRRADGGIVTVCLLDRELVQTGLTDCDRYEPRGCPKA